MSPKHPLSESLAALKSGSADELLEHFLAYVAGLGLELYPAQEEAILSLLEGNNVILATPTGSGKSLVASAMVFRTLANGGRAFYTCPIKALVNEKFFQLSDAFGADRVGMMTGDASINTDARIICCTAEIAASMALRSGVEAPIDGIVMDEFHYYGDKERGIAWHLPLLILSRSRFLLMSATLGDATPFLERLRKLTKREAVLIENKHRPVPLDFTYSEEPLLDTIKGLVDRGRAPIYIVCFTQRAAAEQAQDLMSENYTSKEEKKAILEAIEDVRFDSPYGKDIVRFIKQGVGLHHAGLLPKYRLLVEKLAQRGLLKVICGTDTLGVGVNIPIRTVLFTKLCKFDGEKMTILSVREFQQIAGRAGRKGFDELGTVVVQAPEHVIENIKIDAKKNSDPKKYKKLQRAQPPQRGYVHWDRSTFDRLVTGTPEELVGRFAINHGMLIDLLDNPLTGKHGGYGELLALIDRAFIPDREKRRERKLAPSLFRSLRRAGLIEIEAIDNHRKGKIARVASHLQLDFSLMHALSLWLVDFVEVLFDEKQDETAYALDVLSAVEAILESPRAILERQLDKLKGEKINELKAAGVEYEERMAELEKVETPKPNAEQIYATFNTFVEHHPWASVENIRPKSIARDMYERYATFDEYVRELDLSRSEGVLLRYLSEVVKTLEQSIPARLKTDTTDDVYYFLRDQVREVDSSLIDEWEERMYGTKKEKVVVEKVTRLRDDPKAVLVRARKEMHRLLKHLHMRELEQASATLRNAAEWPAAALEARMLEFIAARKDLLVHHEARKAEFTTMTQTGEATWDMAQTMVDPEGENDWVIEAAIDLSGDTDEALPLLSLRAIREV
ncbi:MAG: DUF3516 domain-containing protein [Myxococcales bacterium]|nr:DUF3516 domain-containing protein [Myxococcales bacterium]